MLSVDQWGESHVAALSPYLLWKISSRRDFNAYRQDTGLPGIGNQVLLLKGIQHGQRLPMKAGAEPARQFLDGADPFAGGDCVTDPVNTAI